MTTLFLCTGNLNRSAAAEVIVRLTGAPAQSAGSSHHARGGRPMARPMRECFAKAALDPTLASAHRSRWLGDIDLRGITRIVGFQPSHASAAALWAPDVPYSSILELAPHDTWTRKVPDPAFNPEAVTAVFAYLLRALT